MRASIWDLSSFMVISFAVTWMNSDPPKRVSLSTSQKEFGGGGEHLYKTPCFTSTLPQNHIRSLLIAAAAADAFIQQQRGQFQPETALLLGNHLPESAKVLCVVPRAWGVTSLRQAGALQLAWGSAALGEEPSCTWSQWLRSLALFLICAVIILLFAPGFGPLEGCKSNMSHAVLCV